MSYDCQLVDPVTKEVLQSDEKHFIRGGTYAVGGTCEAYMNITFNYSPFIYKVLEGGIPGLNGKLAAQTIQPLKIAIAMLGDTVTDNYWDATEGNAKRALNGLLALAYMFPHGEWSIKY